MFPTIRRLPLLFALAALLPVRSTGAQFADGLVATVNNEQIAFSDVARAISPDDLRAARASLPPGTDPETVFHTAFLDVLSSLEDQALVAQAFEQSGMSLPPHAIDRYVADLVQNRFGGNQQALQQELAERRQTFAEWKSDAKRRMVVSAMRQMYVNANVHVSPTEVAQAYERRRAQFSTPARIRVQLIAIPEAETNDLAAFRERLAAGEPFDELARAYSRDVRAPLGGDYGFVRPDQGDLAPALSEAVLALEDGQMSGPVPLAGSLYYVRRAESEASSVRPLDEVWTELHDRLVEERREELYRRWVGHLRARAVIRETLPFPVPEGR